jgi:hypothetical protein
MKLLGLFIGIWIAPALLVLTAIGWSVFHKKPPLDVDSEQVSDDQGDDRPGLGGEAPDHVKSASKR